MNKPQQAPLSQMPQPAVQRESSQIPQKVGPRPNPDVQNIESPAQPVVL